MGSVSPPEPVSADWRVSLTASATDWQWIELGTDVLSAGKGFVASQSS